MSKLENTIQNADHSCVQAAAAVPGPQPHPQPHQRELPQPGAAGAPRHRPHGHQ